MALCSLRPGESRIADAPQPSDEDLVRRVRAGDEAAARLLFERYLPELRAKARARLPSAVRGKVAESDVIQEAWLSAHLNIASFEDRGLGSFRAWLRQILDRKLIDEVRRHRDAAMRDARREERLATDATVPAPDQPSPSAVVADEEEAASVRAAIGDLPSDYAVVLRLIHQKGLTLVEAGERMGRSADAVRKLYARALACLVDRVGDDESSE